jgi:uncharacterized membrane protein YqiK
VNINLLYIAGGALVGIIVLFFALIRGIGLVKINEHQVGIVNKKFSVGGKRATSIVALNGEAGIQADTLAPGWHWFLWPWQYSIEKAPIINVPEGQIAIVIARDGKTLPDGRILADKVDSNSYQDARAFLNNGGFKGRQLAKLTTGAYRINTWLFQVVTSVEAQKFGIDPKQLRVVVIPAEHIGVVTVNDGKSLASDETAAPTKSDHNSFQDENGFISGGGFRGLQHDVIKPGTWSLNPWFVTVEVVPMTHIEVASVGVVNSFVGDVGEDVSGTDFKNGVIVENGKRGVWKDPLNPGLYSINPRTATVEVVPTSNFVLNWSDRKESHGLDAALESIKLRSRDGFEFTLEIQEIIHVPFDVAPKLIARFGSMLNLVQNVLEPMIGNYFRNSAQGHDMLDFINSRVERQSEARTFVTTELAKVNVQGVDTLIGAIIPPEALMATIQQRKLAEETAITIDMKTQTAKRQQALSQEEALAEAQGARVASEQRVIIAQNDATASVKQAEGAAAVRVKEANGQAEAAKSIAIGEASVVTTRAEAAASAAENQAKSISVVAQAEAGAIQVKGNAEAEVLKSKVDAIGAAPYTAIQVAASLASSTLKLVPDIQIGDSHSANGAVSSGLLDLLAIKSFGVPGAPTHPTDAS